MPYKDRNKQLMFLRLNNLKNKVILKGEKTINKYQANGLYNTSEIYSQINKAKKLNIKDIVNKGEYTYIGKQGQKINIKGFTNIIKKLNNQFKSFSQSYQKSAKQIFINNYKSSMQTIGVSIQLQNKVLSKLKKMSPDEITINIKNGSIPQIESFYVDKIEIVISELEEFVKNGN